MSDIIIITGSCTSRLEEFKKYTITTNFNELYIGDGTPISDGVDLVNSVENERVIYYIGGIRYVDTYGEDDDGNVLVLTTYEYVSQGLESLDFVEMPLYKTIGKNVSKPKIDDDVFINRQEQSAFNKFFRFEYITNLIDLETYASGKFFNVIKNG